jgi:molecular chaperone DnaK
MARTPNAQAPYDATTGRPSRGELELSGFKAARRGDVEISVTFEIDADGILNVRAKEAKSGVAAVARMHLIGAQSDEAELKKMQERQARHAVG